MSKHEPLEALARAYDREDASQRGEPDPWKDADDDAEWVSERLACAQVAEAAYLAARSVPEAGKAVDALANARDAMSRAADILDGHLLQHEAGRLRRAADQCRSALASVPAPSGAEPKQTSFDVDEVEAEVARRRPALSATQAVPAEDVAKIVNQLETTMRDVRYHGEYRRGLAVALTELKPALTASEAEATSLRRKLEEACEDITRGIDEEQRLQSRILRETERAEAAERKLEEAKKALEAARDGFIRVKRAASDRSERVAWRAENAILEAEVGADTISRTLSGASE